ncbi:MAG: Mut7-C RNAse domain-containing protein [Anaerolineales bacterium]|nr:Mut7-C RNAse domain-containing protein [Anaerolineales bacterium]
MDLLYLRVYGDLNDFLPPDRRQRTFSHPHHGRRSVKDLLEAVGLPHPEIGLILVDGEPVDFDHTVEPGQRISVFPPFQSVERVAFPRLRPPLQGRPKFVLDVHLGQLARYLRMLGFDVLYSNDEEDRALARRADVEDRILLTRDRNLLKHKRVHFGRYVRSPDPRQQLLDVMRRYDLLSDIDPFTRCLSCNGLLQEADPNHVESRVPPDARREYDEFQVCQQCGNVYWSGSHVEAMKGLIEDVKHQLSADSGLSSEADG